MSDAWSQPRFAEGLRLITLDLDDTLWPYPPTAARIAAAVGAYLRETAPRTASRYDQQAVLRALTAPRETRATSEDHRRWLLEAGLRGELQAAGDDPALAAGAMRAVMEARQQVELYPDAAPAVARLASRFRVVALTDGSADVSAIGIADWFDGVVTATEVGVFKPDPRIFTYACAIAGAEPEHALHAGDDLSLDVCGALDAGLRAAWIHRGDRQQGPPEALAVPDLLALADALGA